MLVRKILTALLLPPTGPLLLAFFGLVLTRRWPRLGRTFIVCGLVSLALLSMPLVSHLLQGLLPGHPPLNYEQAREAQAIVILGGGLRRNAIEYGGDTLGRYSLDRVRYGAWVAKRVPLPVLVSGGVVFQGTPEAALMRDSLQNEFDVPVRWVESQSRTTGENALRSAAILRAAGVQKVLLVTHAIHMRRALAEFEAAGLEVIPAPTQLRDPDAEFEPLALWLLPNATSLRDSSVILHELLGDFVRRLEVIFGS